MACRHHDIQAFDGFKCCLACGETIFEPRRSQDANLPHLSNTPYKYVQLNYALGQEIRLCILFPGRLADDIEVDLVHVNIQYHIDNYQPYEAISYAWATQDGDDSLSQTIRCHGRTISVTKSCEAALRSLRWQGGKRYLWVDAVCIDQSNIKERNHQVGFMSTIYSNASQVIIYLSPGSEATDIVLDYLNGDANAFTSVRLKRVSGVIKEFLELRWFDRVWILQEVALARLALMIAGGKSARWTRESVNKLLILCASLAIEPPSALRWLPASQPERDILSVLHKSRNCSSSDPRDKVYAVLGLAHADFQDGFPIDYSLTVAEVYTQLATHLIHIEGDLRVLKHASGQDVASLETLDIPSWIPKWNVKAGYDPLPSQFDAEELERLTSIWSTRSLQSHAESESNKLLQMFLEYLPKDQQPLSTAMWLQWVCLWLDHTKESRLKTKNIPLIDIEGTALSLTRIHALGFHFSINKCQTSIEDRSLQAYESHCNVLPLSPRWACLRVRAHELDSIKSIIGIRSIHQIHHFSEKFPKAFEGRRVCLACAKHFVAKPICQHTPTIAHTISEEFNRDMRKILHEGKMMFRTQRSIGVARPNVRAGDSIWALDGADVPFVIRRVDQHYVLVGECFLYRALRPSLCLCCGYELEPWPIVTQIIDIW